MNAWKVEMYCCDALATERMAKSYNIRRHRVAYAIPFYHVILVKEYAMKYFWIMLLSLMWVSPAWSMEVEGVVIADTAQLEGQNLRLNGAGVRTKFFFNIYVGALYTSKQASSFQDVIADTHAKRVTMTFMYEEVERDKLVDGWISGFKKNQSKSEFEALNQRLQTFNAWFVDGHKGDALSFDFSSDGKTVVQMNGQRLGVIDGNDFQQALLAVWLGNKPADNGLKKAMLQAH